MISCPRCQELNGDSRSSCWKCNSPLPVQTYRKICPQCGSIYSSAADNCSRDGSRLVVYDERSTAYAASGSAASSDGCWMYAVSLIIPLVGIILGLVYIARGEDELGKSLIITGVVASIVVPVILWAFVACMAF